MLGERFIGNLRRSDAPFIAGVVTEISDLEDKLIDSIHILEMRVDMLPRIDEDYLDEIIRLAYQKNKVIILTVRSRIEGGLIEIHDKERQRIYSRYIDKIDAIDVEISSEELMKRLLPIMKSKDKFIIGSYHDFSITPHMEALEEIFNKGKALGADIVKIATMVNTVDELTRLIEFTLMHRNDDIVTLGMGDRGRITRILNPVIGSLITFGTIKRSSAPGQLSVDEIIDYWRRLF